MSVWKKVSKINQKRHRERHQPNKRAHRGLLEKKKDYVKRATDFHKKQKVLKKLKEKALNKNPNEYYHHMVNSRLYQDHIINKPKSLVDCTVEQNLVIENKNISYIHMKCNMEQRKLEKLKSRLHLVDFPCNKTSGTSDVTRMKSTSNLLLLDKKVLLKVNNLKEKQYNELIKRINRKEKLMIIKGKMEVEKNLKNTKHISNPKLISQGTKTKPAVYEWKYERKK